MRKKKQDVAKQTEMAERAKKVLRLKLSGASYPEIAEVLEISMSTAHGDIQRAIRNIPKSEADQYREEELMKLDRLQRSVWEEALGGDHKAIDRVLKIIDRRAKFLGLDAPQQVQVGASSLDLDAAVKEFLAVAREPQADLPEIPAEEGLELDE